MAPYPRLYEPGGVLDTAGVMVRGDAGGRRESGKSIAVDTFSKWQARLLRTTVDRCARPWTAPVEPLQALPIQPTTGLSLCGRLYATSVFVVCTVGCVCGV